MDECRSPPAAMPPSVSHEHVHPGAAGRRGARSLPDRTGYEVVEIGSGTPAVSRAAQERLSRLRRAWPVARESEQ